MELWMSAEVGVEVGDACRLARNAIEPIVNEALKNLEFVDLVEWTMITIILSDEFIGSYPEVAKRTSKGKKLEFRLQIPHDAFKVASAREQLSMIFDTLERSVDMMEKLKVSIENQEKLRSALSDARATLLFE